MVIYLPPWSRVRDSTGIVLDINSAELPQKLSPGFVLFSTSESHSLSKCEETYKRLCKEYWNRTGSQLH